MSPSNMNLQCIHNHTPLTLLIFDKYADHAVNRFRDGSSIYGYSDSWKFILTWFSLFKNWLNVELHVCYYILDNNQQRATFQPPPPYQQYDQSCQPPSYTAVTTNEISNCDRNYLLHLYLQLYHGVPPRNSPPPIYQ